MKSTNVLLRAVSQKLNEIQKRNPKYLDSKEWKQLKQLENKLYKKMQEEMEL